MLFGVGTYAPVNVKHQFLVFSQYKKSILHTYNYLLVWSFDIISHLHLCKHYLLPICSPLIISGIVGQLEGREHGQESANEWQVFTWCVVMRFNVIIMRIKIEKHLQNISISSSPKDRTTHIQESCRAIIKCVIIVCYVILFLFFYKYEGSFCGCNLYIHTQ